MEKLMVDRIFFEALDYPMFARPNFYIRKQEESGWAKGVFLTALNEVYHSAITRLRIHHGAQKRENQKLKLEDFSLSLNKFIKTTRDEKIDKRTLDELHNAIKAADLWGTETKNYSSYQVLSFVEYALWFMRNEFQIQAKEKSEHFRPQPNQYFTYLIAQDAPFFDFPVFKASARQLLLESRNLRKVEKLLSSFYKAALDIVKLWNEKIYFVEEKAHKESSSSEMVRVEFHSKELNHSWWNDQEIFQIRPHKLYQNQDFANYAAKIANTIGGDFSKRKEVRIKIQKKSFIRDFTAGIRQLYKKNDKAECIRNIREGKNHEGPFRDWFWDWFEARGYTVNSESEFGNKHIDLKAEHIATGTKIVEFKGWWWKEGREKVIQQTINYLTDFESDGYIFIIVHPRKNIIREYMKLVMSAESGYKQKSWRKKSIKSSAFQFFRSLHWNGSENKEIFHFIFQVSQ